MRKEYRQNTPYEKILADDIDYWFTSNGSHIPVKKGQTKQEAFQEYIANVRPYYDEKGKMYRRGNNLLPNQTYTLNGYTYTTDEKGRIIQVTGKLKIRRGKRTRIKDSLESIGKGYQLHLDHRGHVIASRFGGDTSLGNLIAQNAKVNLSDYKRLENEWAKALKEGKEVSVNIRLTYEEDSFRPQGFLIKYVIGRQKKTINLTNYKES